MATGSQRLDSEQDHAFRYDNSLEADQLRLLTIEPRTQAGDKVSGHLSTINRKSASYKALSYAWGDTSSSEDILVNGHPFPIHKSLLDALERIRHDSEPVVLWTDAICINQTDIYERNRQVQAMGQTYADAAEVIVWLGPRYIPCGFQYPPGPVLAQVAALAQGTPSWSAYASRLPVIEDVIGRPYFRRLWTFQEAVLASRGTVMLGDELCDLDVLLKLNVHLLAANINSPNLHGFADHLTFASALECFGRLSAARQWKLLRREVNQRLLVQNCQSLLCLDPRDHIFGVSGLAQSMGAEAEVVDYSLSVAKVFTQFIAREVSRSVDYLIVHGSGENEPSPHNLKSWVPDFSMSTGLPQFYRRLYSAGGRRQDLRDGMPAVDYSVLGDDVLAVPGYTVDRILYIGPVFRQGDVWSVSTWQEVEALFLAFAPYDGPYPHYSDRRQAFWRTVIANASFGGKDGYVEPIERPAEDNGAEYEIFLGRAEPRITSANPAANASAQAEAKYLATEFFRRALSYALMNRRPFVTRCGYYGLGSPHVQHDDCVVIIPGLQMPFCSREREGQRRWRMLGPAYVHGIMKGEFIEAVNRSEARSERQILEFD